jgi:hypothetical protein
VLLSEYGGQLPKHVGGKIIYTVQSKSFTTVFCEDFTEYSAPINVIIYFHHILNTQLLVEAYAIQYLWGNM